MFGKVEQSGMGFESALRAILAGRECRRGQWVSSTVKLFDTGGHVKNPEILRLFHNPSGISSESWQARSCDLMAHDWEVIR